jgi:carbonic anhydrase
MFSGEKTMLNQSRLSRRGLLQASSIALAAILWAGCTSTRVTQTAFNTATSAPDADAALQQLLEGNRRFAANRLLHVNVSERRRIEVAHGQKPFAMILGCVDSRVPPELIFDRGLGDLFVVRTAGEVLDQAVLGSLEFGVAELRIPLLVVLGHQQCGAVKATLEVLESKAAPEADINALVLGIRPAVEQVKDQAGDRLDNAVRAQVALTVTRLMRTLVLSEAVEKGALKIVGAYYDLDNGRVSITVP